jgi:integrase
MAFFVTAFPHDPDRFLILRGGHYHYKRRVPADVEGLDERGTHVRRSLKTGDLAVARARRDAMEAADDAFWLSLLSEDNRQTAKHRYEAAVKRARALGYAYRHVDELAAGPRETYLRRVEALNDYSGRSSEDALLGQVARPKISIREALTVYFDEITPHELTGKSDAQRAQWRKIPQRAVNNFVEINGDIAMVDITREHALKQWKLWSQRIAPKAGEGVPTHTASSGNRDVGAMRVFYREYFKHLGEMDRKNPFEGLSFKERSKALRTRRPPFPVEWITSKLLAPGAFESLNAEARGIIFAIIETGGRPSEICNLDGNTIFLDGAVPYISVEPRVDPDDPREIKTGSSVRLIPLVGVALAVFKKHPNGFPLYRNKEMTLSATLNKHLKVNGLKPTPQHKVYSLRHSFEDRMKAGGFDTELRMMLMGHAIDRPNYGSGGGLEWRHEALKRIALPFDPSIV